MADPEEKKVHFVRDPRYAAQTCVCFDRLKTDPSPQPIGYGTHGVKKIEDGLFECESCGTRYGQAPLSRPAPPAPDRETIERMESLMLEQFGPDGLESFRRENNLISDAGSGNSP